MRKLRTKIGAMIASATLAVAMMAMPASAGTTYTPVTGDDTFTFNKYLIVNEGSDVPDATFNFSIASVDAINADSEKNTMAVLSGPVVTDGTNVTAPTVGIATFAATDVPQTTVASGDSITLTSGEAYVKKVVSVDFSGVSFTEPGIYRYILSEVVDNTLMGMSYDVKHGENGIHGQRTLDVYVTDKTNATTGAHELKISGYVMHETLDAPSRGTDLGTAGGTLSDKSDGFVNSHEAFDLKFSKTVAGNQASRDKYFEFTVTITGAVPGTEYTVSYAGADVSIPANPNAATTVISEAKTQPEKITVGTNGSIAQVFYLQHGQSIAIRGLAEGTKYMIVENAEDYKAVSTTNDTNAEVKSDAVMNNTTGITANTTADFTNTRDGIIPTGVILSVAPWVIAGIVIIGGIVFFAIRSKKKYDEE